MNYNEEEIVCVLYVDHKRAMSFRNIVPIEIKFMMIDNRQEYFLRAYNVDKNKEEMLEMSCIQKWNASISRNYGEAHQLKRVNK